MFLVCPNAICLSCGSICKHNANILLVSSQICANVVLFVTLFVQSVTIVARLNRNLFHSSLLLY